jgi:hypothetical protein
LDSIKNLERCLDKSVWRNLTNDEVNNVIEEVEIILSTKTVDTRELAQYFDNLVIDRSHYNDKATQIKFVKMTLLLVCGFDFNDIVNHEDFKDASSISVQGTTPMTTHMARNQNDETKIRSELFLLAGEELAASDESYEGSNILYNHSCGSVYFIDHVNVVVAYVILHPEISYSIDHNGCFIKGGKATGQLVYKRGTCKYTYPPTVYRHECRRINPVCSKNDVCNGTLEVRQVCVN